MTSTDFAALAGEIDADNAIIRSVSVITVGDAKGHGMRVDARTLAEVKAAAETYAGGLKVKTDHYTGFNEIVGTLKNFAIDGDQLRADLFLLKNHEATARILEMAALMPDTFGLSISFSGDHERTDDGAVFARCAEVYSCDLVDAPAANPSGLFSAKVDSLAHGMDEKQFAEAIAAALAPINEKLSAFEAFVAEANTKFEALAAPAPAPEAPMPEADDEESGCEMKALAAELAEVKATLANFGAQPVAPAVAPEAKPEAKADPTNFAEALAAVKAEGLTGTEAVRAAINRFPSLYLTARNEGIRTI